MTFALFLSKIETEDYVTPFEKYLEISGVSLRLSQSKSLVNHYVQAEFARQLYGDSYYYQLLLKRDPMIQKVLTK
jgi:carboxyl-terminal processing protease